MVRQYQKKPYKYEYKKGYSTLGETKDKVTLKAKNKCWCSKCNGEINRGDDCIIMYKKGWKAWGISRFNLCGLCIRKASKELNNKILKQKKFKLIMEKI